jgi:hypothetical protein
MALDMKCDKCNGSLDNGAEVYCDRCYTDVVRERDDLKSEVDSLKDELADEKQEYRKLEEQLADEEAKNAEA